MAMGSDRSKIGQVTVETVRKAIMGAHIRNNRELYAYYGGIPQECRDAIDTIRNNYAGFEESLRNQLSALSLTRQFLGDLITARLKQNGILASPMILAIFDDQQRLEHRLRKAHNTTAFQTIFREIGNVTYPDELDRRLLDAWAEIRVIDQLLRERFVDICKVSTPADFVARYMSQLYAIQVTRIGREPQFPDLPLGEIGQIYNRVKGPIGRHFWDSLARKNSKFKDAFPGYVRRIVLVTVLDRLQDPMNRHIACQQIKGSILGLTKRHFEEVQWLLDNGSGGIFWVETGDEEVKVRCLADWRDDPTDPHRGDRENCCWREIDLDSEIPAYIDEQIL